MSDPRCQATFQDKGIMAFIAAAGFNGARLQCRLEAGHVGPHRGSYQPFPGFANEYREWTS